MNERRRPRPAAAVLRGKIRQIEERMARIEDHLEVIRIAAARSRGLPIRLRRLERKAGAQVARVRRTLAESSRGVKREMEHLRRGLEAGIRAGAEAYRRRKR